MKTQIKAFKKAFSAMKRASTRLDRKVEVEIKKRNTVPELHALVDQLPRDYRNARRVYEKILLLDESAQATPPPSVTSAQASTPSAAPLAALVLCKHELFFQTATGVTLKTEYPRSVEEGKAAAAALGVEFSEQ